MKVILLVKDDLSIQDAMRLVFDESEFRLIICNNAEEAFYEDIPIPDLYIIDKQLPGTNGLELCQT